VDVECHLPGRESENGVGMGGAIIEELCDGNGDCFCAFCVSRSKGESATSLVKSIAQA
jgi:hypothetical protein